MGLKSAGCYVIVPYDEWVWKMCQNGENSTFLMNTRDVDVILTTALMLIPRDRRCMEAEDGDTER